MMKLVLVLLLSIVLNGCGIIAPIGTAGTSTYQTYKTVTMAKAGVDVALTANDKQTTTDKAVSVLIGRDCKLSRSLKEKDITVYCKEVED